MQPAIRPATGSFCWLEIVRVRKTKGKSTGVEGEENVMFMQKTTWGNQTADRTSYCGTCSGMLAIFLLFLLSALCAACASSPPPVPNVERESPQVTKELSRWGELPSVYGSNERVQVPSYEFDPDVLIPQLPALTGLSERTDIIFHPLRSNDYLYERPGDILEFQVTVNPRGIRYRLAEVNQQLEELQTIVDETTLDKSISVQLPDKENALYILTLEAMGDQLQPMDTAIFFIDAVPQVIHAELWLDQTVFQSRKTANASLHLKNYGPNMLQFGGDYIVEKYEDGSWYRLPLRLSFSARAYGIRAGEVFSQPFDIPAQLSAGTYRVVKGIQARGVSYTTSKEQFGNSVYLAVPFEVEEHS